MKREWNPKHVQQAMDIIETSYNQQEALERIQEAMDGDTVVNFRVWLAFNNLPVV